MKYQLVIQFSGETEEDFDELIEVEDELEDKLPETSEVDGHDFGSGEMNIFILTNEPLEIFEKAKTVLAERGCNLDIIKVAYRDINFEEYTVLWPKNLTDFNII